MTRIYLIRHAEAEGNLYRVLHGQTNSSVTEMGLEQIKALSRRFEKEQIDEVYASDLVRTQITAKALTEPKGLTLHPDPRFREVKMGDWEGRNFGYLYHWQPDLMQVFSQEPASWHVEGAERYEQYTSRFLQGLTDLAQRHDGQSIAIFSHGLVMRGALLKLFAGKYPEHMFSLSDNTAVTLLEYQDGQFEIVYLNDNSHLPPEYSGLARQTHLNSDGTKLDYSLWFQPAKEHPEAYGLLRNQSMEAQNFGVLAMFHERPVGYVELQPVTDGQTGCLSQFYLLPDYQKPMYELQLLGYVVFFCRQQDMKRLQILMKEQLQDYQQFFLDNGFEQTQNVHGETVLEKNIDLYRFM